MSTYPLHLQQSKIGGKKLVAYIKPMLAHLHDKPFDNDNWIFEIKWDGYRAIAELKGKNTRLYSRNGLSFKEKYPIIFQELASFKKNLVIDGEIVALDKKGMPSFQLLQQYEQAQVPLVYYVFDCLYVNGKSIENKPLLERKEILKSQLPESVLVKYCDHIEADGKAFFALTKKKGLEGMMAKKADSKYREGIRSADWLKVKHVLTEDAVIAGYTRPRGSRKYFGALVLGKYKNGKLQYIGHTGTGFNEENIKDVYTQMQSLITEESPFSENIAVNAPVTWIKPKLVCSLKYAEVTADGSRRQPVFMGLRIDLDARDVKE